ncbi:MAG TPA: acyl carrier protein [Chthoniobacterales bacterium]|nr:acyl carrier protein [Chthoniobacterales bacterium]
MRSPPTQEEADNIRRTFRRCREGTSDAIVELQRSGDIELIPTIVRGIVWRYVHEDRRPIVDQATPETLLQTLGIDSLTMMEIILDVQDALDLVIEDADLRNMRTIGDVIGFLQTKYTEVHGG